jgi:hypothetical protein
MISPTMGNILTISIYNYLSGKLVALLSMFLRGN